MSNLFIPLEIGTTDILIIVAVIVLLFGAKKIPELMHGIGKGVKEFKDGMRGEEPKKEDNTQSSEKK